MDEDLEGLTREQLMVRRGGCAQESGSTETVPATRSAGITQGSGLPHAPRSEAPYQP